MRIFSSLMARHTGLISKTFVSGDWLTGTYCYCDYPGHISEPLGLGHYYQIEYYNVVLNKTFILTSICPTDYKDKDVACVPGGKAVEKEVLAGDTTHGKFCREFRGKETFADDHKHHANKFCYKPLEENGDDFIEFNDQERNISPRGGQSPEWQKQKVSDKACERLCHENLDAKLLRNPHKTPSHQVRWIGMEYVHFEIIFFVWC